MSFSSNSRCSWRTEMPSVAAALAGVRVGSGRCRSTWRLTAASRAECDEFPASIGALIRGATRQGYEATKIAQHGFTKFVGKQRHLRPSCVDSCAE